MGFLLTEFANWQRAAFWKSYIIYKGLRDLLCIDEYNLKEHPGMSTSSPKQFLLSSYSEKDEVAWNVCI